jgi:hypothetical protein
MKQKFSFFLQNTKEVERFDTMPASKCFKKSRRERQEIVADKKKSHLSKRFRCEMNKIKIKKKKYEIKRRRRRAKK